MNKYYTENRERILKYQKEYYKKNQKKRLEYAKLYKSKKDELKQKPEFNYKITIENITIEF